MTSVKCNLTIHNSTTHITTTTENSTESSIESSSFSNIPDEQRDDYDIEDHDHHHNLPNINKSLSVQENTTKRDNERLSFDSSSNIFDVSNCSFTSYDSFSDDDNDDDCNIESTNNFSHNETLNLRLQSIDIDNTSNINMKNNNNDKHNGSSDNDNNNKAIHTKGQKEAPMISDDFHSLLEQNGLWNPLDISAISTVTLTTTSTETSSILTIAKQYFVKTDEEEYFSDKVKENSFSDEGCWSLSPISTIPSLFPSLSHTCSDELPKQPQHQYNIATPYIFSTSKVVKPKLQNRTTFQPEILQDDAKQVKNLRNAIHETSAFIEHNLSIIISQSKFLQEKNNGDQCSLPVFRRSEIITGRLLGKGGFSDVYEVIGYQLDPLLSERLSSRQQQLRLDAVQNMIDPNTGRGRYAIKQLRESLLHHPKKNSIINYTFNNEECDDYHDFQVAACDLVLEGMYLARLNHPNIIKVHGLPYGGHQSFQLDGQYNSYFLICDRLNDTLDHRIDDIWTSTTATNANTYIDENTNKLHKSNNGNDDNISDTEPSIINKLHYALQLANALQYLHQNRIVYRDLKPTNIGFSIDDTDRVILFDFGLCRELPNNIGIRNSNETSITEHDQHRDNTNDNNDEILYEMSGVGTRRYMAPEIINTSRYNQKVDVYSWSMVLWEMMTLSKPYLFHSVEDHRVFVCQRGERPPLFTYDRKTNNVCLRHPNPTLLEAIQYVLKQSWRQSVNNRFSVDEVCDVLKRIISLHQCPETKVLSSARHSITDKLSISDKDYHVNKENRYYNERNSKNYDEHRIHYPHARQHTRKSMSQLSRPHHQYKPTFHSSIKQTVDFTLCYSYSFSHINDASFSQSMSSTESIKMQPSFYETIFGVRPLSVDDTSTPSSFQADLSSSCRASLSSMPSITANSFRSLTFFSNSDQIMQHLDTLLDECNQNSRINDLNDEQEQTSLYDSVNKRVLQEIIVISDDENSVKRKSRENEIIDDTYIEVILAMTSKVSNILPSSSALANSSPKPYSSGLNSILLLR